jgi:RNA polymerase sigma-70 factor, ECF subfamily
MPVTPAIAISLDAAGLLPRRECGAESGRQHLHELTSGLACGDDAIWAEFHRDYGPLLFRYLLGGARGNYELAADALQQTYLRVARHARPCDSAPQFESWLRRLAGSALNDCRRRRNTFWQRLRGHLRGEEEPASPAENVEQAVDDRVFIALDSALARLAPDERALLEAKYFSGTDVRTLAAKLNVSPKAVESRLTRARAELRRQLTIILSDHDQAP